MKGASKFEAEYDRLKERHQMLVKLIDFWTKRIRTMEQELAEKAPNQLDQDGGTLEDEERKESKTDSKSDQEMQQKVRLSVQ